jgi:hypothetical protein
MITFIFIGIIIYVGIQLWSAMIPYLFARSLMKNKKFVKAVQDLDNVYKQMDENLDDFCKRYPKDCKDAEERRRAWGLIDNRKEQSEEKNSVI